ncbi:hypothetical protein PanWU01x14_295870 [Parasponia andersonii]|uniref:Uncharacterized protein n=1 Tax=Parasponia andersonii TaxID=3476 RepID=A0A2P5AVU6_PARAD|nr:hypothetical protein PanWU01x14_295870 [Parasponia andersonii]
MIQIIAWWISLKARPISLICPRDLYFAFIGDEAAPITTGSHQHPREEPWLLISLDATKMEAVKPNS